ncbi:MAG: prepilin-type N-terminal cleavage/methylation domain-containing protein [Planctomycetes bacterium]|nr:prepilin-type N-terminal cleavage/methylation domain-containing protein [Planctomycetota bacterium]
MKLSRPSKCRGGCPVGAFTLIEMLLVMVLIAILSSMAVAQYGRFVARQRVEAASRRIVADLKYAQKQARSTSAAQEVQFDLVKSSYTLVGMADPDHAVGNYMVRLSRDPYQARLMSADFGGDASVIYNGHGVPDSGGTITVKVGNLSKTITLTGNGGRTFESAIAYE